MFLRNGLCMPQQQLEAPAALTAPTCQVHLRWWVRQEASWQLLPVLQVWVICNMTAMNAKLLYSLFYKSHICNRMQDNNNTMPLDRCPGGCGHHSKCSWQRATSCPCWP